eukprot:6712308-Prymnesium_polylepis.1
MKFTLANASTMSATLRTGATSPKVPTASVPGFSLSVGARGIGLHCRRLGIGSGGRRNGSRAGWDGVVVCTRRE